MNQWNKSTYQSRFGNSVWQLDNWVCLQQVSLQAGEDLPGDTQQMCELQVHLESRHTLHTGCSRLWRWFPGWAAPNLEKQLQRHTQTGLYIVWSALSIFLFLFFRNADYIMQGKQLIRLPSTVFEWASCAAMQGWVSSFWTVGHKLGSQSVSAQAWLVKHKALADERYEEMMVRKRAWKGCRKKCEKHCFEIR